MHYLFANYPGINGFLGTRASIMLDVVFVALIAVLPVLAWSIWLVKRRKNYALHKRVQLLLSAVLLITVVAFEIDMRWISGWRERAHPSRFWESGAVMKSLYVHLIFSVTTAAIWFYVVVAAISKFPKPPAPSPHSARHKWWAWIAAFDLTMTAMTVWIFYWMAFIA
jgi:putative membrane protein